MPTATGSTGTSWCGIEPSAGRATAFVLPAGWTVVASSTPGSITQDPDGRQRLYFENNRNDEIQVLIRARRFNQ